MQSVNKRTIDQVCKKIVHHDGVKVRRQGREERFGFDHEIYFEYFLSQMIKDKLLAGTINDKPSTLDIGEFPAEAVHLAIRDYESVAACLQLANALSTKEAEVSKRPNCALNLGRMLASAFVKREEGCADIKIRGVTFRNCDFGKAQLRDVHFVDCEFSGVDLSHCSFEGCTAENCRVDVAKFLTVSDSTRLGIEGFVPGDNLFAIYYHGEGEIRDVNRIAEIVEQLGGVSSPALPQEYSPKAKRLLRLLPRVVGTFRNASTICKDDDDPRYQSMFNDPAWNDLEAMLCRLEIIVGKMRHRSGPPKMYFSRGILSMDEILEYETTPDSGIPEGKIRDFWREIRAMQ